MVDLTAVRDELQAKMEELANRIQAVDEHLRSPGLADSEENAVLHEDDEVLNKIGDSTLQELREVKHAIQQIDSGCYGVCTGCGESISTERLEALPYATTCIKCA